MSGEGTYVCNLDSDTLQKAKEELNEDPTERASQIEALRKWCKEQPHINSRTDDGFLLRFLRNTKFSMLKAQKKIENFWTVRSVPGKGVPEWFNDLDPLDPSVTDLLENGLHCPLPGRDDQNRKIFVVNAVWYLALECKLKNRLDYYKGGYDPKKYTLKDVIRIEFMTQDVVLMDEMNQVHGIVGILDFSQFSTQHLTHWDRDTIGKAMKCWQDVYPTRNKALHFINTPTIFNAIWEIFKFFMKEKTKKRVQFHKDSLESLHAAVPKKLLPTEFGGDAGPYLELCKQWKETLIKNREEIVNNCKYGVDESKRPKTESEDRPSGWGITGSFRKLALE